MKTVLESHETLKSKPAIYLMPLYLVQIGSDKEGQNIYSLNQQSCYAWVSRPIILEVKEHV